MRTLIFLSLLFVSSEGFTQVLHESLEGSLEELGSLGEVQVDCHPGQAEKSFSVPIEEEHQYIELGVQSDKKAEYQGLELSVLTPEQAQMIHEQLSQLEYIPKKYMEDGCYARAHEVALIAQRNGLTFGKAFLVSKKGLLYPKGEDSGFHESFQGWRYHTAAMALVRDKGGELSPVVFDIGASKSAQKAEQWNNSLTSREDQAEFVVRKRERIYHDSSITAPNRSIIKNLKRTQDTIDELGYDEYIFRLEQGWL